MSVTMLVYLNRAVMPVPEAWAQAIHEAGFPMDLPIDFDPNEHTGFLPCRYDGNEGGFEFSIEPVDLDDDEFAAEIGSRDSVVEFVTHSSFRELMTSVIASGVLASMTDGVLIDTEGGDVTPAQDAMAWAKRAEAEIREDLKRHR